MRNHRLLHAQDRNVQRSRRQLTKALARRRRSVRFEQLEDRRLLAVGTTVLGSGNDLVFQGDAGVDAVSFAVRGDGVLQHNLGGRFGFESDIDLDSQTAGEQFRLISEVNSLSFQDASSNDNLRFSGANPFEFGSANLSISVGSITVEPGVSVSSTSGLINLNAGRNILLDAGASLATVDGGIQLSANTTAATAGDFAGIEAIGAVIQTTGTGNIEIAGVGGYDTSSDQHFGIHLISGTSVRSTATGLLAGTITIAGTGGDGRGQSRGVYIRDAGTSVTSVDGDIRIMGTGGSRSDGASVANIGVTLLGIDGIASTGTGANAAKITIQGMGGENPSTSYGVYMSGTTVDISSVDGDISIVGQGGGRADLAGINNHGVYLNGTEGVFSLGTTADAARISIMGNGGASTSFANQGVVIQNAATALKSYFGDITIVGRGGIGSSNST